jgi:toxin ParE1/3/4
MRLPVVLTQDAEADFDTAADWYQMRAGLGEKFTAHVRATLDRIAQMPELHPILYRGIRRVRVRKFPYCIYYRVQTDRVEIIAMLHGRRDPSAWRSRA